MNKRSQSPLSGTSQISYKTNQNLDRLNKISDRLNNIHVNLTLTLDEHRKRQVQPIRRNRS
jgi:hypothetical protein